MELAGEVAIGRSPQQVWEAINDPQVLRECIPGCEEIRQISPAETHVRVLMKMGPVRARFVGKILMRDVRPDEGCVLDFEGSGGAAGFARGSSTVTLAPQAGGTILRYSATASIGGKLGQIGGRMIDASAKQMADQFFRGLRACLDAPAAGVQGQAAHPAGDAAMASASTGSTATHGPASAATHLGLPSSTGASAAFASHVTGGSVPAAAASTGLAGESVRILWFVLGMASTGFGVWLAGRLAH